MTAGLPTNSTNEAMKNAYLLGNTLVIPPSVAANTARKPYLKVGMKAGESDREALKYQFPLFPSGKLHARVQVFVLPHFVHQLPDDASVQDQVVKQQTVT